ncbi:hypothetical protein COB11_03065 [Candidatus Aerophobetes bacterium]|uniref:Uncharacterized protein n=1 Tax=Aerophobetes bacterium TaxID=2030807 RepID=A0A2A4YK49_UNCAE|nr:MAG: hypothetical protein COB11_03065 [Candidatus Aerophobetes bacterium]
MGKIDGDDAKVPTYKQEFHRGVDLFDKSFQEYMKTKEPHKKAKFKDVMNKALDVMNKSAKECLNNEQKKLNEEVHKDYDAYLKSPNKESTEKLEKDVGDLKDSI